MSFRVLLLTAAAPLCLLSGAYAGSAAAQTRSAPKAPDLSEVVVTAAPYAVSLDTATTSIDVLKREELQTGTPGGLGDVLGHLPGLRSSSNGPGASRPVIRGFSGPRVLVLQNGLGQIDASALSPDHAVASDPAEAVRIEVLRGPSALAYGGSGVGGVVNVIDDRVPDHAPERTYEGHATLSASSVDDGRAYGVGVKSALGKLVFTVDADHHQSDDYKTPVAPVSDRFAAANGLTVDPEKVQRNSDMEIDTYGAGVSYIGEKGFIGVAARKTSTEYGVPYAQILSPIDPDAEGPVAIHMNQTRYDLRGERSIDFGPFQTVRISAGKAKYDHSEVERNTGEVGTTFLSSGQEARLELVQGERDGWKGAVGVQGLSRDFEAIGDEAIVPTTKVKDMAVFTLQRFDSDNWGVDGGLRLERHKVDAALAGRATSDVAAEAGIDWNSTDQGKTFDNVSAALSGYWKPTQNTFYALSLSRNGRAPTDFELFADGPHPGTGGFELGNPNLKSEIVVSLEATARWTSDRVRLEGHLWGAKYDGFIDQRPTGESDPDEGLPIFAYIQTDAKFIGAEIEGEYALWQGPAGKLSTSATYDVVRGDTDLGPPARIPPWSLAARLNWEGDRFTAGAEVRRLGEQDRLAAYELPTDAYTMVNLKTSYAPFVDREVKLFAQVSNLTDVEAREHVSFLKDVAVLPGRSFRAGVTYNF